MKTLGFLLTLKQSVPTPVSLHPCVIYIAMPITSCARLSGSAFLTKITAGMDRGKKRDGYWTEETIREAALQCKTRTEFRQRFRRASTLAYEGGKYEEITAHMVSRAAKRKPAGYWTLEKLREAAASCTSIHELMIKYPSVQTKAIALGIYDEITAHIPRKLADAYTLQTALVKAKQYSSIAEFKTQKSKRLQCCSPI
jgi:hypothetical protein